ncbi:cyclase family protein [Acrocarpospora catenulata]|uniref:cyclase family protein n=1 Tax=Acrocarpospora catenulata TaxID=2836182 RepID=UPI001BDB064B|nr:cyclase family protein [Acrocarpospora catenulata]
MADWSGSHIDTSVVWPTSPDVRIYDLAVRLQPGMTRHPAHPPYAFALSKLHGQHNYPDGISSSMEVFTTGAHVGSHVDALGHISKDGRIFGDRDVTRLQSPTGGLEVADAEEIPPLVGRGHLIDAERLFGRPLTPADGIGPDELESWFADREEPGPGSIVLVRTGWMRYFDDMDRYLGLVDDGLPGVTRAGAEWLSSRGILAGGSDTMNFEHKPAMAIVSLKVHLHFLVERGLYIMESLNLENLAAAEAWDFTFFALPLRIKGATGSPLRPIAIVPR